MNVNELLLKLIGIESFSGNEVGVANFIVNYLKMLNFEVEKQKVEGDRYNIIAKKGEPKVFLSAHMDTVRESLEIKEDSEKIYGRGACDTKGSIASMLIAGRNAVENGITNFGYLFTVGEEVALDGARTFSDSGKTLPFVIVGEPTSLSPINGHYGIFVFKIISRGKSAHTSNPELGENAIEKIINVHGKMINELNVFSKSSLTLAKINGGTADNVVPDYAEALYSIRISPEDGNDYEKELREIVGEVVEIEVIVDVNSIKIAMPEKLKFLGIPETVKYCTDLSFLKNGFVLGPGDIAYAHGSEEFVFKEELSRAVKIYEKILEKMSSD